MRLRSPKTKYPIPRPSAAHLHLVSAQLLLLLRGMGALDREHLNLSLALAPSSTIKSMLQYFAPRNRPGHTVYFICLVAMIRTITWRCRRFHIARFILAAVALIYTVPGQGFIRYGKQPEMRQGDSGRGLRRFS